MTATRVPSLEAAAWLALTATHGRRAAVRLARQHGSPGAAVSACVPPGAAERALRQAGVWERAGVHLLPAGDARFPAALAAIPDAPVLLFVRGDPAVLSRAAVAIVGARRASRYGLELAASLARDLAGCGFVVVSGLALGVDSAAHRGALEASAATVAVLGSGVDRVQPRSNAGLGEQIVTEGGALISEYPPGSSARPHHFPERNRLISGLSAGVVIIEAAKTSGSLITARLAAEQGRDVMAVPAVPGLPNSEGGNRLLKAGAALVESVDDVLDALGCERSSGGEPACPEAAERSLALSADLVLVLDELGEQARSADELSQACGLDARTLATRLVELELGGFVQRVTGGYIRRPSRI